MTTPSDPQAAARDDDTPRHGQIRIQRSRLCSACDGNKHIVVHLVESPFTMTEPCKQCRATGMLWDTITAPDAPERGAAGEIPGEDIIVEWAQEMVCLPLDDLRAAMAYVERGARGSTGYDLLHRLRAAAGSDPA